MNQYTEEEVIVAAVKRLCAENPGYEMWYPHGNTDEHRELQYSSPGWHGYGIRFRFDKDGNIIESSAGA